MKYIDALLNRLVVGLGAAFIIVAVAMIISVVGYTECFIALALVISLLPLKRKA